MAGRSELIPDNQLITEVMRQGNVHHTTKEFTYKGCWVNVNTYQEIDTSTAPHLLFIATNPELFDIPSGLCLLPKRDVKELVKWISKKENYTLTGPLHKMIYSLGWIRCRMGKQSGEFTTSAETLSKGWKTGIIIKLLQGYEPPEIYIETENHDIKFKWPGERLKIFNWLNLLSL